MDKVILGEGCIIDGEIGKLRPNNNQIICGSTGTGKSMSCMLPTILNMQESSLIATYSKPAEARELAGYLSRKGYDAEIIDLTAPEASTIAFDPVSSCRQRLDIENLSKQIVLADPLSNNEKEIYWNDASASLLSSLIEITMMSVDSATMVDVIDKFNLMKLDTSGSEIHTGLDTLYKIIGDAVGPDHPAIAQYTDFCMLAPNTGRCVRDTLAKSLRRLFPEPVHKIMRGKKRISFEKLATEKTALIIITSPVNVSLYLFANLLFSTAIKELLEFAQVCDGHRLPRDVRLMFDDFACGGKLNNFPSDLSIFRSVGLSAMILLQSESQLRSLYSEAESTCIINNVSCYAYFPGGMDLKTCQNISERLDAPLPDILYAPMEQVIVMQSGKKPVMVHRYDTPNSREYIDFRTMYADAFRIDNVYGKYRQGADRHEEFVHSLKGACKWGEKDGTKTENYMDTSDLQAKFDDLFG